MLILAKPEYTFSTSGKYVCLGKLFSASLNGTSLSSYTWSTGSQQPAVSFIPSGDTALKVTITATNGCVSRDSVMLVNKTPTLQVFVDREEICRGDSVSLISLGANSYSWTTGQIGNLIQVAPQQTTTYTILGTSFGCISEATITVQVNECVTEVSNDDPTHFSIYPNPSSGEIIIRSSGTTTATLWNCSGQKLSTLTFSITEQEHRMNFLPGVYFLVEKNKTYKIVVLK
jgi:hypothetical protein